MIPNRQSKSQMCRPFAVLRDKRDQQTSLARDLRQQTVHPRLLESTLERKDYDLGFLMALMSSSRLIIVRGESSRPRREGLTRCPQSMISIVVGQTDPIPSYLCRQKSKDFSANPNSFRQKEELRCRSASEQAERGPICFLGGGLTA